MPANVALNPQVLGRLAETEAAIIKLLTEGVETFRTTISIEAAVALAAVRAADKEKRDSFSNFCAVALAEYAKAHDLQVSAADAELVAKIASTMAPLDERSRQKLMSEFERLMAKTVRARRSAA